MRFRSLCSRIVTSIYIYMYVHSYLAGFSMFCFSFGFVVKLLSESCERCCLSNQKRCRPLSWFTCQPTRTRVRVLCMLVLCACVLCSKSPSRERGTARTLSVCSFLQTWEEKNWRSSSLVTTVACTSLFVLETIRTGAMRVVHIPVKTEETQRLRIEFVLYCPICALDLKLKRADFCRK